MSCKPAILTDMKTRWRGIPGLENKYEVSSDGRIRRRIRIGRESGYQEKSPVLHHTGYLGVVLCNTKYFSVHRLVAQLFLDVRLGNERVSHKNGDRLDNRVENLTIHYRKAPAAKQLSLMPTVLKFWDHVDMSSDCWLWTGKKNGGGYGSIAVDGKTVMAHRYSWVLHREEIPPGLVVMHKCDTPACVNPAHLMIGTYSDNMYDAVRKGRKGGKGKKKNRDTEQKARMLD